MGLKDMTGNVQGIAWRSWRDRQRDIVMRSKLLEVRGFWQPEGDATSIIASHLLDLSPMLGRLETESRIFS